jgi:putative selenate reductase
MSDAMRPLPFDQLLDWMLAEYRHNGAIFGIPRALFHQPRPDAPYAIPDLYGHYLATPIGPGAGPHTQLAQNIVAAWLCGGRFIELKTVQIMDELVIPRPCIDMADEGYNVEWSQELKLEQSLREYVKAWVLLHALHRLLGHEGKVPWGTVFNMSVGYDLKGIQSPALSRFMDGLADASGLIAEYQAVLEQRPAFRGLVIPTRVSDNVTLSTMHGCPPGEIERIGRYLLVERSLHTIIKLNPTLLGRDAVLGILGDLGYADIRIPEAVFAHDLQYNRAVQLVRSLGMTAKERGLHFGVKLSNTLAAANHRDALPGEEMYMSGRALYPVTMQLFLRLGKEFHGRLAVSYSAGADALNLPEVLSCGARPVTAVSDLLKPGGYGRLAQYLENLEQAMAARGAASLDDLASGSAANLEAAAAAALRDPRFAKGYHIPELPKVASPLGLFDCITAPCVEQCAIGQDVPAYAWHIARGRPDQALAAILARNPLPECLGYVCNHLCQTRCTQHNYEQPVAIRALKGFAAHHGKAGLDRPALRTGAPVVVVGSGPSGLAAAAVLALNGVPVTVFEAADRLGGLLAGAIPPFRLPAVALQADLQRIQALGVRMETNHPVRDPAELLLHGFAAVYLASGAPLGIPLGIPGEDGPGVYEALHLLDYLRRQVEDGNRPASIGKRVLVIGGGASAVDAARAALRLGAESVTLVYRRTRAEMPAIAAEVDEALREGVALQELTVPLRVIHAGGRPVALECRRAILGEPGADGRRQPVAVPGSAHGLATDAVVVAVGQRAAIPVTVDPTTGATPHPGIFAGGDAVRGPATVVQAVADGRRTAEAICRELGLVPISSEPAAIPLSLADIARIKRARGRRQTALGPASLPLSLRTGCDAVELPLSKKAARAEAARCLQCASLCDKCVEVCPNRANYTYELAPLSLTLPVLSCHPDGLAVTGEELFQVAQGRQIVHLDDLCNACGNCTTFCVHPGKPFQDKPRLFLRRQDFQQETALAFHVARLVAPRGARLKASWLVRRREGGDEAELRLAPGWQTYEDRQVKLMFSPAWQMEELVLKEAFPGQRSLASAGEMYALLLGLTRSLPFLPYEVE